MGQPFGMHNESTPRWNLPKNSVSEATSQEAKALASNQTLSNSETGRVLSTDSVIVHLTSIEIQNT